MDSIIVPIVCALIGSGASTAIVTAIINKKKKETGESQGIRWLMQDRLEHVALAYMAKGTITYEEWTNWNRGHYIYHDLLGGTGDLDPLKESLARMNSTRGEKK